MLFLSRFALSDGHDSPFFHPEKPLLRCGRGCIALRKGSFGILKGFVWQCGTVADAVRFCLSR